MNIINIFLQSRYDKDILINKFKEYHYNINNINKISNIINSIINYPEYNITTIYIKRDIIYAINIL